LLPWRAVIALAESCYLHRPMAKPIKAATAASAINIRLLARNNAILVLPSDGQD
jgi:hypothetical protein